MNATILDQNIKLEDSWEKIKPIDETLHLDLLDVMRIDSSRNKESINLQDNLNFTEFDGKVSEFVLKTESGWICGECSYFNTHKGHVQEHAEFHIDGFSFKCQYCYKTFSKKRAVRRHGYKCKNKH